MVRRIPEVLKTSSDSLAGSNLWISDRVLAVTIANVVTRNQRTVKLTHVIWFELKHKIPLLCLVCYWEGKKLYLECLKNVIISIVFLLFGQ